MIEIINFKTNDRFGFEDLEKAKAFCSVVTDVSNVNNVEELELALRKFDNGYCVLQRNR